MSSEDSALRGSGPISTTTPAGIDTAQEGSDAQGGSDVVVRSHLVASSFQGPLPSPAVLDGYEQVLPGAAERIFNGWEKESEHRRQSENRFLWQDYGLQYLGMGFGFTLALVFLAASVWLVHKGHGTSGIAVIIAEIAALAGVFIYAHRNPGRALESDTEQETDTEPTNP